MVIERLIHRLRDEQTAHAHGALETVDRADPNLTFSYGVNVGFHAGLARAERLIEEILNDQDAREKDL